MIVSGELSVDETVLRRGRQGRVRINIAHNRPPQTKVIDMPGYANPGFDTLALHAGAAPDPATGARAVPIHLTTSFVFESSEHAASLFNMERSGHVYSRLSNPTNAVLEERVAALEGGSGAIARCSAACPLAVVIAPLPPSRAATRSSRTALVGFESRL